MPDERDVPRDGPLRDAGFVEWRHTNLRRPHRQRRTEAVYQAVPGAERGDACGEGGEADPAYGAERAGGPCDDGEAE